jgi:DNA-binding transcriptional ArsR family regulator
MALSHPLPAEVVELVARRFRVLGEPTRIRLLERLRGGEATVQELAAASGAMQQNVSKHLGILLEANIVRRRKDGNFVRYQISDPAIFAICDLVCESIERQLTQLGELIGSSRA